MARTKQGQAKSRPSSGKKELPPALRENADRLKRGESLHKGSKGPTPPPKHQKPVPQKPKIRSAKQRRKG